MNTWTELDDEILRLLNLWVWIALKLEAITP